MVPWLFTGFWTIVTRRVTLVEQELHFLPEHPSSPPVSSGVRVTRSLVFVQFVVHRCLSFWPFPFGHCAVCPSIYGFWIPLWYLQNLLSSKYGIIIISQCIWSEIWLIKVVAFRVRGLIQYASCTTTNSVHSLNDEIHCIFLPVFHTL